MRLCKSSAFGLNESQQWTTRFRLCTVLQSLADYLTSFQTRTLFPSVENIGRIPHTVGPPFTGNRLENQYAPAERTAEGQA